MQITSAAVKKVREMGDKQQPEGYGLRVIVDIGGPDGFFYDLDFDTAPKDDDQVKIVVPATAAPVKIADVKVHVGKFKGVPISELTDDAVRGLA